MSTRITLNRWDGGMTADTRGAGNEAQLIQHFDFFTKEQALIPYRQAVDTNSAQTTNKLQSFIYGYNDGYFTFMLGIVGGAGADKDNAKIFYKNSFGSANPIAAGNGADGTNSTTGFNLFVDYKNVYYGSVPHASSGRIWSYDPSGSGTFTSTVLALNHTDASQGLVHSKDDILYLGIDNKIYYKNGAGAITLGLTLPSNLVVTSLCEYGNFLAIACRATRYGTFNSKVFLWDRDTSLSTVSDTIDWGVGNLLVLENIDGYLIGASLVISDTSATNGRIVFRKYGGGGAILFNEILCALDSGLSTTFWKKQKYNNRLYFGVSNASLPGSTSHELTGVWSVGRSGEYSPFTVFIDRVANNTTEVKTITGFLIANEVAIISYTNTSDTHAISITDDDALYTTTSVYRTTLNPGMPEMDKFLNKQLVSVGLSFDFYTATSPSVELQYAVDGGSFTSIFTDTTTTDTFKEVGMGQAFTEGRNYEFKIISKGVEVNELVYTYEVIESQI